MFWQQIPTTLYFILLLKDTWPLLHLSSDLRFEIESCRGSLTIFLHNIYKVSPCLHWLLQYILNKCQQQEKNLDLICSDPNLLCDQRKNQNLFHKQLITQERERERSLHGDSDSSRKSKQNFWRSLRAVIASYMVTLSFWWLTLGKTKENSGHGVACMFELGFLKFPSQEHKDMPNLHIC